MADTGSATMLRTVLADRMSSPREEAVDAVEDRQGMPRAFIDGKRIGGGDNERYLAA